MNVMRFDILTLFPDLFSGYLSQSLIAKAIAGGLIEVNQHNIRDWSTDKHKQVDDRPFGGGPGMVFKPEPVISCVEEIQQQTKPGRLVLFTPAGRTLNQAIVEEFAKEERLVLVCGRYEGFDQRIMDILEPDELSIGDYVLNGGETAAMVVIDAVSRLIPGVLGDEMSAECDSFSMKDRNIEHAQYTRPREFRGHEVPDVLMSGDHKAIEKWREEDSKKRTAKRNKHPNG